MTLRFYLKTARFAALAILIALSGGKTARADEPALSPVAVVPREIGVLLLPAVDTTPEASNMLAPRQSVIRHRQQAEFIARQFKILGETLASKAAKVSPSIDLTQVSARTPANIDLLARRAGADWVVHTVVEEVKADSDDRGTFTINTRLLLQVWDVHRHDWLINQRYTGQATGSGSPIMIFMHSLDDATKGALGNLVGSYPRLVTVEGEDSLTDYLAGQAAPVVGDPEKPFRSAPAQ
jgi:hypothetical protein